MMAHTNDEDEREREFLIDGPSIWNSLLENIRFAINKHCYYFNIHFNTNFVFFCSFFIASVMLDRCGCQQVGQ